MPAATAPAQPQSVRDLFDDPEFVNLPLTKQTELFNKISSKDAEFLKMSDEGQRYVHDKLFGKGSSQETTPPSNVPAFGAAPTSNLRAAEGSMGPLEAAGREALAVGTGAVGSVGDLLNFPGALSKMVGGPSYHLPIGTEDVQGALGFKPSTGAERVGSTVGGFLGPGAWLKLAGKLGLAPETVQMLQSLVSSGPKADIALGVTSGLGSEAARQAFPGEPLAPAVGGMVAPVGVATGHAVLDKGLPFLGKVSGVLREQRVGARENALNIARREEEAARGTLEATRAAGQAEVEAAGQTIADRQREALAVSEREALGIRDARRAAQRGKLEGQQAFQQAQGEAAGLEQAATTHVADATRNVEEAFVPLAEELSQGVLQTRTTAGTSRAIPQVPPSAQEAGQAVHGELATTQAAVPLQKAQEGQKLITSVGEDLGRLGTLGRAQAHFQAFFDTGRKAIGKLFEATEAVTGEEHIFQTPSLSKAAEQLAVESSFTGQSVPRGTSTFLGLSTDEAETILNTPTVQRGLSTGQRDQLKQILTEGAGAEEGIPFWAARRIESALNHMAYDNAKPIGTLTQGKARRLLSALQDDFHDFFTATPEGATIAPQLADAKKQYSDFIQVVNNSIVSKLLNRDPVVRSKFLQPFTGTSKSPEALEQLRIIKEHASPDVWNTLKAYTLGELYRDAQAGLQFSPQDMLTKLTALRRSGKMDILFEPEEVASIERYMHTLTSADPGILTRFRAALARKEPGEIVDYVFAPGKLDTTQHFKTVTTPETFDSALKAWSNRLLERLPDMTPAQIHKELAPLAVRDGRAPSQLDVMLGDYPGVADRITALVQGYNPRVQALEAAKAQRAATTDASKAALEEVRARTQAETSTLQTSLQAARDAADEARDLARIPVEEARRAQQATRETVASRVGEAEQGVQEAAQTRHWAQEGLSEAKRKIGIPEDMSVHDYMRIGGVHIRTGSMMVAGLVELLAGLRMGSPTHAALGGTLLVGAPAFRAFANSPTGRRVIREGLPGSYGPSAARWVAQSLGAVPEPAPTVP